MSAAETTHPKPTLHPAFVENMVRTFNDSNEHGVHLLFNEWWPHAPDVTIERYLANFRAMPGADAFLAEGYLRRPQIDARGADGAAGGLGRPRLLRRS